eukprot:scaffold111404_cov65-Phaeocystis_antarctica.AAC.4
MQHTSRAGAAARHTAAAHPALASGGGSSRSSLAAAAAAPPPRKPGRAQPGASARSPSHPRTPTHCSRAGRTGWPCRSWWRPRPRQSASQPATECL